MPYEGHRYSDLMECMDSISLEELIMAVRRQSQGFSRGTSAFRGVTHHPSGALDASAAGRGSASWSKTNAEPAHPPFADIKTVRTASLDDHV
jgi:hypothetical protein